MIHLKQRCTACGTEVLPGNSPDSCYVCGEREWECLCKKHGKTYTTLACPWCAYCFRSAEFSDPAHLADALRSNWGDALYAVGAEPPSHWLRSALGMNKAADHIDAINRDSVLEPDEKLTGIIMFLDPKHSLWWRGQELTAEVLRCQPALAARIFESSLPDHCKSAACHDWLSSLHASWRAFRDEIDGLEPKIANLPSRASLVSLGIGVSALESVADVIPMLQVTHAINARRLSRSVKMRFSAKQSVVLPPEWKESESMQGMNSARFSDKGLAVSPGPSATHTTSHAGTKHDVGHLSSGRSLARHAPTGGDGVDDRGEPLLEEGEHHGEAAPAIPPSLESRILHYPKSIWSAAKSMSSRLISKLKLGD